MENPYRKYLDAAMNRSELKEETPEVLKEISDKKSQALVSCSEN